MDIRLLSQYSKVSILHIIYVTDKIEKKTLPLIAEKKKPRNKYNKKSAKTTICRNLKTFLRTQK